MKLLEKLKNTFFEEEYVEVEEPEVKKVEVARKVEPKEVRRDEIKKEVKKEVKKEEKPKIAPIIEEEPIIEKEVPNYSDAELSRKDSKVTYFEDDDFVDIETPVSKKEEPKKIYGESIDDLYSSIHYSSESTPNKPYSAPLKEAFKPTPIISPIYGVLDKNYRKEEVVDKKEKISGVSSYVSRKNADLDSVRKKAYGGVDPLEQMTKSLTEISLDEVEEDSNLEATENNLLYDMTMDDSKPMVGQVTLADAEEYFDDLGLEYNIDYKDTRYEKATGRRRSSKQDRAVKDDDDNLEDNLFDLIDSIYEDGEK